MWKQKNQQSKQNDNFESNTFRNYTTLYHTYQLLYCKGHIKMTITAMLMWKQKKQ